MGNYDGGVYVIEKNATIGGLTGTPGTGAGNVISGNGAYGLQLLLGNNSTSIQGNIIGLNAAGTAKLGNTGPGIWVEDGTTGLMIGGTVAGASNIISGNTGDGILFDGLTNGPNSSDSVQGNFIGTDINGTATLGNAGNGITINTSTGITIGGTTAAARNVISGNTGDGVQITGSGATGNLLAGQLHRHQRRRHRFTGQRRQRYRRQRVLQHHWRIEFGGPEHGETHWRRQRHLRKPKCGRADQFGNGQRPARQFHWQRRHRYCGAR